MAEAGEEPDLEHQPIREGIRFGEMADRRDAEGFVRCRAAACNAQAHIPAHHFFRKGIALGGPHDGPVFDGADHAAFEEGLFNPPDFTPDLVQGLSKRIEPVFLLADDPGQGGATFPFGGRKDRTEGVQVPFIAVDAVPEGAGLFGLGAVGPGVVVADREAGDGRAIVHPGAVLQRTEAGESAERFGVADGRTNGKRLVFKHIDADAVGCTVPVGGEKGVFSVVRVHHQEVVAGGGKGNAQVLRGAPAPGLWVFPGNIEVVSAHPVESVGGEIQGISVGGEHGKDFISGAHHPFVKDPRARPARVPLFRQVQVPHPGSVRGGEDAAACPLGQIQGEGTAERVQRIRRAAPGFVFEGIVEEKVFPGEGLPGDHFRVGAGSGHIQRVLGLVDAAVDLLLGFQAEGAAEGGQIGG